MEVTFSKGDRIVVTDNRCQIFTGVVKNVNQDLRRLLLSHVVQLPDNIPIEGYRHFDWNEVTRVEKLEEKPGGAALKSNESCSGTEVKNLLSESKRNDIQKLQGGFRLITDFGNKFHSGILHLKACERIGVYGMDVSKGRCVRLSVLAIITVSNIFIFDIQALGDDAFEKGLRTILESADVVKVTHDSRLLSDCLYHKHLVSLENVRDVEAEDLMVVLQERRTIRKHARSLNYLLGIHLGVEVSWSAGSQEDWNQRPLPASLLQGLVSLVSYLLPLQEAIQERYLQRLTAASTLYNTHLRSLDFYEFLLTDTMETPRVKLLQLVAPVIRVRGTANPKAK